MPTKGQFAMGAAAGGFLLVFLLASAPASHGQSGSQSEQASAAQQGSSSGGAADSDAAADNGGKKGNSNGEAESKPAGKKDDKTSGSGMTKMRIVVTGATGKPVENASVYVRFPQDGGLFHKDRLQELDLKTNQDGSVKVPEIPQGEVLVQVVAKGWKTYGKWYEIKTEQETIEIKLDPPPHWY